MINYFKNIGNLYNYSIFHNWSNNINISFIILFFLSILVSSCNIFSTRNPEEPDNGNITFLTPNSPNIVIFNLNNAINEKNAENYITCLTDSSNVNLPFNFLPSANANSTFLGTFDNWTTFSEKTYMLSLISNMESFQKPLLNFTNSKLDLFPDSAIYTSNYELQCEHKLESFPKLFQGNLRFTIVKNNNGLWYIKRWYDYSNLNDTTNFTWSFLKGRFFN